jgi:hypothetical protein
VHVCIFLDATTGPSFAKYVCLTHSYFLFMFLPLRLPSHFGWKEGRKEVAYQENSPEASRGRPRRVGILRHDLSSVQNRKSVPPNSQCEPKYPVFSTGPRLHNSQRRSKMGPSSGSKSLLITKTSGLAVACFGFR